TRSSTCRLVGCASKPTTDSSTSTNVSMWRSTWRTCLWRPQARSSTPQTARSGSASPRSLRTIAPRSRSSSSSMAGADPSRRLWHLIGVVFALVALRTGAVPVEAAPTSLKFAFTSNDPVEQDLVIEQVRRYNAAQDDVHVEVLPGLWKGYEVFDSYVRFMALQDPSV